MYGSYNACSFKADDSQCCRFEQVNLDNFGFFCVDDGQRDTELDGMYRDKDDTLWEWTCKHNGKPDN